MCYLCNDLTKETVKYASKDICEDCLKLLFETTPKAMEIYYTEDCLKKLGKAKFTHYRRVYNE
jgi:hypothetical protein